MVKTLLKVRILKIDTDLPTPNYKHHGDAGMDLFAAETTNLMPGERIQIKTGTRFAIPYGYEMQIRPRSGLALKHSVTVLNTPGTIDSDYRGELKIILINHGKSTYTVHPDDRIAQLVFTMVIQAEFIQRKELTASDRGRNGFGSTGI